MDTKNLSLLFKTSLLAATMSMVVGCSDNPIPTNTFDAAAAAESEIDTAIENAASNGTLITVADGLATDCEVAVGNLVAVEVDSVNAPGQYLLMGKADDVITATGCVDAHTGSNLPTMKSKKPETTTSGQDKLNLTPLTTLVQGYIEAGATEAEAKTRTAELLGVSEEDLEKNPVEEAANGNDALVKAAVKLTAVAKTLEKGGNTDPIKALAAATKTKTATNDTLDKAIQDDTVINSVITDTTKRAETKTAAKAVNDAIEESSSGQTGDTLLDTIAKVVKVVQAQTNAQLNNKDNIKNTAANQTLNDKGKTVVTVEVGSDLFKKIVDAKKAEAKKNPDAATFLPTDVKEAVKTKVEELKTISGATVTTN